MPGYPWSNPNHAVNLAERMRHTALHVIAGQRGDYESYWRIVAASFEPWTEGEWDARRDDQAAAVTPVAAGGGRVTEKS